MPNYIYELQSKSSQASHITKYLGGSFHGFHLRRVLQLTGDGFIQFEPFLDSFSQVLKMLKYVLLPVFLIVYLFIPSDFHFSAGFRKENVKTFILRNKNKLLLSYFMILWFVVPWFAFATYSGELSDYYFAINRFPALIILAYVIGKIFDVRSIFAKIIVCLVLLWYGYVNTAAYLAHSDTGLKIRRADVLKTINSGGVIQYTEGVPESYLYYYYMRQRGKVVYEH